MTTASDVTWGSYQGREGPMFRGTRRFQLPSPATEEQRLVAVFTSVESGRADALNFYDKCLVSSGYIQLCESPWFGTSSLLGAIAERDPDLLDPLKPALEASGAEFRKTTRGKWRFHFLDPRGEVDTAAEQQQLFLLNSTGLKGSWDEASKTHAKGWVAALANVLAQDEADKVQMAYVATRMKGFATAPARKILFDDTPSTGWAGAARAIFLSFAGNLPGVAAQQLEAAVNEKPGPKWTKDWTIHLARRLTFGPNIAIYPARYNAIRPVVERLYGVDLPDFAGELKAWTADMGMDPGTTWGDVLDEKVPTFTTVKEVQQLLVDLGYDLGPAGADGKFGAKTRAALMTFQGLNGLTPDGVGGSRTRAKMLEVWQSGV
jgi:hypothetical protein